MQQLVQKQYVLTELKSVIMRKATSQVIVLLVVCLASSSSHAYEVAKATVKIETPKGFEVSIPDEPGISLFAFHGKLNAEMEDLSDQTWATDIVKPRNGRWIYHNREQKLKQGDVLYYWTTVRYNGLDYHNFNQQYEIGSDDDANSRNTSIHLHSKSGSHLPIIINGNPTINIYVT